LPTAVVTGHRHGSRVRTLTGTFGKTEIAVPRARLNTSGGKTTEWKRSYAGAAGVPYRC
jgi:putative transposase